MPRKGHTLFLVKPKSKLVKPKQGKESIAMEGIKTQKALLDNRETLIVAVDIAKRTNKGYYRFPDNTDVKPFGFFNNGHGFNKFWEHIDKAMKTHGIKNVVIGFESTGSYGEPLIHYLRKKPVRLVQVNPMHVKKLKEVHGNSPNKTDDKDPMVIADIIELGHALSVVMPEGTAAELRRLTQAREKAVQRRTILINQLEGLVFAIFPELLQIIKSLKAKSAQYLLEHYPTPKAIEEYGLENLIPILKRVSCGSLSTERIKTIYDAAKTSGGINEGCESIIYEIQHILDLIKISNRFIVEVEKKMSDYLEFIPYSKFILSIKGIGKITVAGLIGEVGDFRQFKTISEITKLAGLDLFEISSGNHKGTRRISKRGRPLMRKLLYFATLNLTRKGGIFHEIYKGYLNRGMMKMKALIAISRKLLRVIFALVRNHTEYIYDYSEPEVFQKEAA